MINYLLTNDKIQHEYVKAYTDFTFLVNDEYKFENGLFSGYDAEKRRYDKSTWGYQIGKDGYVGTDPTLQNPRCVYQLMKKHYSPLHAGDGEQHLRHAQGCSSSRSARSSRRRPRPTAP